MNWMCLETQRLTVVALFKDDAMQTHRRQNVSEANDQLRRYCLLSEYRLEHGGSAGRHLVASSFEADAPALFGAERTVGTKSSKIARGVRSCCPLSLSHHVNNNNIVSNIIILLSRLLPSLVVCVVHPSIHSFIPNHAH